MYSIDNKTIRTEAGTAALIFGAVSGGFAFLGAAIPNMSPVLANVLTSVLWLVKLVGLIWLMRYVMIKFKNAYDGVGRRQLVKYGTWIALFSAGITAACFYIVYKFVSPDLAATQMEAAMAEFSSMLDSNSVSMLESIIENYAIYALAGNLIWCFIYGRVLSLIIASRVTSNNPFDDDDEDDD